MRFLLWLYLLSQAQINLVISGIVQDQSGAAFLGAEVDLLQVGTELRTTTTDASGAFRFDKHQPGSYEVSTHKECFNIDSTIFTFGTRSQGRKSFYQLTESLIHYLTF